MSNHSNRTTQVYVPTSTERLVVSNNKRDNRHWFRNFALLIIGCGTILLTIPLLSGASASIDSAKRKERLARIDAMSTAQKENLARNFRRYMALTEAERDKLRRLHDAIEEDRQHGGALKDTLGKYNDWLQTLSVAQLKELRQTSEPTARVELIKRFQREQLEEERRNLSQHFGQMLMFLARQKPMTVNPDDLQQMLQVVEQETSLPENVRQDLAKRNGVSRNLTFLTFVRKRTNGPGGMRASWPDDRLLTQIINTLPRSSPVSRWKRSNMSIESQRQMLGRLIAGSLWKAMLADVRQFHATLDDEKKKRLAARSEPEKQAILLGMYFDHVDLKFGDTMLTMQWLMNRQISRSFDRGSGGRGPGVRKDGRNPWLKKVDEKPTEEQDQSRVRSRGAKPPDKRNGQHKPNDLLNKTESTRQV